MADDSNTPPSTGSAPPAQTTASPSGSRPLTAVTAGTRIIGTYEIERLINSGGMGEVYRGRNIHNGEAVAIKIVLPHLANDEMISQLFQKEAKVLGRLFHEAIVRYHVFTNDPEIGRPCIVMEFVEGTSLNDVIKRGPMPPDDLRVLLRRLAAGLDKAHTVGVVHRDLSPDNVILEEGMVSHAKIIDFGIAKSSMKGDATLLQGQFAGKFSFVAPEQLGAFGGTVDGRTDIYSLGLMMVAVAQGRVLNMGKSIIDAVRARNAIPDLSGVDPALRPLIEHMLEPNPADRPASMAEVIRFIDHPDQIPEREHAAEDDDRTRIFAALPPTEVQKTTRTAMGPRTGLTAAPTSAGASTTSQPTDLFVGIPSTPASPAPAPKAKGKGGMIAALLALVVAGGGAGAYFAGLFDAAPPPADPQQATATETPPAQTTDTPATQPPADGGTTPPAEEPPAQQAETETPPAQPATPEPAPQADPADPRAQRIAWADRFNEGPCAYFAARGGSGADVEFEGFAQTVAPFSAFTSAYAGEFGAEPRLTTRLVNEPQCPIIDYISDQGIAQALPATLVLDNAAAVLRSGEAVSGRIEGLTGRAVSLFLVNGAGGATNLKDFLIRASDGTVSFSFTVNLAPGAEPTPQLLLAVVTDQPVTSLDAVPSGVTARALMPFMQSQLDSARQQAVSSLAFFRLEN